MPNPVYSVLHFIKNASKIFVVIHKVHMKFTKYTTFPLFFIKTVQGLNKILKKWLFCLEPKKKINSAKW